MVELASEMTKSVVADDVRSAKVLKLRAVRPRLLGKGHQIASPIEIAIVIGRYVSDEVRGLTFSKPR